MFGSVVEGMDVVRKMEAVGSQVRMALHKIIAYHCGWCCFSLCRVVKPPNQ